MALKEVRYRCEVITPVFCMGGDGETPEIRPPSIKGMMRFWWRALHPEFNAWEKLLEEESKIFGSSNQDIGRSKFRIHVDNIEINGVDDVKVRFHRDDVFTNRAIMPESKFDIILYYDEQEIPFLEDLFELSVFLGDLGKRSRRGFGSFIIIEKDNNGYNMIYSYQNLLSKINRINNMSFYSIGNGQKITLNHSINANKCYPFIKEIFVGEFKFKTWNDTLKFVTSIASDLQNRYKNDDSTGTTQKGRYASPLYITIGKNNEHKYGILYTHLNACFKRDLNSNPKIQQFKKVLEKIPQGGNNGRK